METSGVTLIVKVTDLLGSLASVALTVTVPEEFPERVTLVEALPLKSVVLDGVPRTAAFAGDTVQLTPTPLSGWPPVLSTSTWSGVGSPCPGFWDCPFPCVILIDPADPGVTVSLMVNET